MLFHFMKSGLEDTQPRRGLKISSICSSRKRIMRDDETRPEIRFYTLGEYTKGSGGGMRVFFFFFSECEFASTTTEM